MFLPSQKVTNDMTMTCDVIASEIKLLMRFALFKICLYTGTKDTASVFKGIDFQDMTDGCVQHTEDQIRMEITASLKYLAMGAYFAKDSVNRPGFSKLFFDAASEEREHAYKLIEYLSMRGRYLRAAYEKNGESRKEDWKSTLPNFDISKLVTELEDLPATSGLDALKSALTLETVVTKSIRALITKCEDDGTKPGFNHFHVSFQHHSSSYKDSHAFFRLSL